MADLHPTPELVATAIRVRDTRVEAGHDEPPAKDPWIALLHAARLVRWHQAAPIRLPDGQMPPDRWGHHRRRPRVAGPARRRCVMAIVRAADLPEGSIVASRHRVAIAEHPPGTPNRWAGNGGIVTDEDAQWWLGGDFGRVLRHGYGD